MKVEKIVRSKKYDLVVLDEILNAWGAKLVTESWLRDICQSAQSIELVMTGRKSPLSVVKSADYVSLIKKVKHPFDKKVYARKGIEY